MGLRRLEFWTILAVGVLVFLFAGGPIWQRPFAIDGPILWSYGVVVVLGWVVLGLGRRLTPRSAALSALELVLAKFVITLCVAVPLWAHREPPPVERPPIPETPHRAARLPTVLPSGSTGAVSIRVERGGAPIAGALTYLDLELSGLVFAPTTSTLALTHDGRGLRPDPAVIELGQPLILESTDGQLHALSGTTPSGEVALNLPVVPKGRSKPYRPDRALGWLELTCRVHEGQEATAHLLILAHPFHGTTDAAGQITFRGVPAGGLTVSARSPDGTLTQRQVTLEAGGQVHTTLTFP